MLMIMDIGLLKRACSSGWPKSHKLANMILSGLEFINLFSGHKIEIFMLIYVKMPMFAF